MKYCRSGFVILFLCSAFSAAARVGDYPYCQIMDRSTDPLADVSLGYVTREDVADTGDWGLIEEKAHTEIAYLRTGGGDFNFAAYLDSWFSNGGDGADLPGAFGEIYVKSTWALRTQEALTFRLDLYPGFYGEYNDPDFESFALPVELSGIQAFHPQLSMKLGVAILPGFDEPYEIRSGIRWAPSDDLLIDLFYPASRILWQYDPRLGLTAGFVIDRTSEYQLRGSDTRDRMMIDETRYYIGLDFGLTDTLLLTARGGLITNRRIEFEHDVGADVDDGYFFALGIGGRIP